MNGLSPQFAFSSELADCWLAARQAARARTGAPGGQVNYVCLKLASIVDSIDMVYACAMHRCGWYAQRAPVQLSAGLRASALIFRLHSNQKRRCSKFVLHQRLGARLLLLPVCASGESEPGEAAAAITAEDAQRAWTRRTGASMFRFMLVSAALASWAAARPLRAEPEPTAVQCPLT